MKRKEFLMSRERMDSSKTEKCIITRLPYGKSFLFVDSLSNFNENEIDGKHTFQTKDGFYKSHFIGKPITPGVLLIETMVQIGLVCFGVYLLKIHESSEIFLPLVSHIDADLIAPVYPGEIVSVHSEKIYLRNNMLKCKVKMINSKGETVVTMTGICTFKFISE